MRLCASITATLVAFRSRPPDQRDHGVAIRRRGERRPRRCVEPKRVPLVNRPAFEARANPALRIDRSTRKGDPEQAVPIEQRDHGRLRTARPRPIHEIEARAVRAGRDSPRHPASGTGREIASTTTNRRSRCSPPHLPSYGCRGEKVPSRELIVSRATRRDSSSRRMIASRVRGLRRARARLRRLRVVPPRAAPPPRARRAAGARASRR